MPLASILCFDRVSVLHVRAVRALLLFIHKVTSPQLFNPGDGLVWKNKRSTTKMREKRGLEEGGPHLKRDLGLGNRNAGCRPHWLLTNL